MMTRKGVPIQVLGLAVLLATASLAVAAGPPAGNPPDAARPDQPAEALSGWQWQFELPLPPANAGQLVDFILAPEVFDLARADLADLRLYDARDQEVPYALRVRHTRDEEERLPADEINRRRDPDRRWAELTLDLGANPIEYHQIELATSGSDFRRRVEVEGSDDAQQWGTMVDDAWIAYYPAEKVDIRRVEFPACRFRYLRLRVFPDLGKPNDLPEVASATVLHTVEIPGEYVSLPAELQPREAVPAYGGPGSAWIIKLGASQVPCERLDLDVANDDFVRPYHLEKVEPQHRYSQIANGELRRRAGSEPAAIEIEFLECTAGELRLVVTDNRNPPLDLTGVKYTAAARQIVFAHGSGLVGPLRLYVGNPKAQAPNYELAATLPAVLDPPPVRAKLGPQQPNPVYRPEPKPWTERWPWLVYVVLGTTSAVLLVMLAALARQAVGQSGGTAAEEAPNS